MLRNTNKQMLTYTQQLRNVYAAVTVLSFALTVGQCKQKPCDTFAVVRDQTGLDGCGILFETEKDGLLLPQNFDQLNMAALDGDTIAISYTGCGAVCLVAGWFRPKIQQRTTRKSYLVGQSCSRHGTG